MADPDGKCTVCRVPVGGHFGDHPRCAEVQQLRAALAEVLGWMTHRGSSLSGIAYVRSHWVDADRVEELRRLVRR